MRSLPRPASFDSIPNHFTLTVEYWNPWVTSNAIAKITFLVLFQWTHVKKKSPRPLLLGDTQVAVVNRNNNNMYTNPWSIRNIMTHEIWKQLSKLQNY